MYSFEQYEVDFKNTFPKNNLLVYEGDNPSNEQLEIIKILKKSPFKSIYLSNTISEIENLIKTANVSIVFLTLRRLMIFQSLEN